LIVDTIEAVDLDDDKKPPQPTPRQQAAFMTAL
jgi:hypothetical protein